MFYDRLHTKLRANECVNPYPGGPHGADSRDAKGTFVKLKPAAPVGALPHGTVPQSFRPLSDGSAYSG